MFTLSEPKARWTPDQALNLFAEPRHVSHKGHDTLCTKTGWWASFQGLLTKPDNCDRATALPEMEVTEAGLGLSSDLTLLQRPSQTEQPLSVCGPGLRFVQACWRRRDGIPVRKVLKDEIRCTTGGGTCLDLYGLREGRGWVIRLRDESGFGRCVRMQSVGLRQGSLVETGPNKVVFVLECGRSDGRLN